MSDSENVAADKAVDMSEQAYEPNFFTHMPRAFAKGALKITFKSLGNQLQDIKECQQRCWEIFGTECIYAQWKEADDCIIGRTCTGSNCGSVSDVNVQGKNFNRGACHWCQ